MAAEGKREVPRLVIAGANSGAGKTTLTTGLAAAVRRRGLIVQPFKVGPDYIDPTYHTLAAGRTCRNLDAWMLPPDALLASFARGCHGADIAVVEGVMGLFDGFGYDDDEGSTARVAKLIGAPVVVVLDISATARSAAATALGFARFDPELNVAGYVLNGAAASSHGAGVAKAVSGATGLPCYGWLPRDEQLAIPERHLGLIPTAEAGRWERFIDAAAERVARYLDVEGLLAAASVGTSRPLDGGRSGDRRSQGRSRGAGELRPVIAVARDAAFNFYYEDNLDLLREAGAVIVEFSPLSDSRLPPGCCGAYIGGGFPEVYAADLAANAEMRRELATAIAGGMPVYAECGGLMYLTGSICDLKGEEHPMVGALPGRSVMAEQLSLGYREVVAARTSLLAAAGARVRGHEFHYSTWIEGEGAPAAWRVEGRDGTERLEGYADGDMLASYVHLHWGAAPEMAARFVRRAARHMRADGRRGATGSGRGQTGEGRG